jgi:hypothetical protein
MVEQPRMSDGALSSNQHTEKGGDDEGSDHNKQNGGK